MRTALSLTHSTSWLPNQMPLEGDTHAVFNQQDAAQHNIPKNLRNGRDQIAGTQTARCPLSSTSAGLCSCRVLFRAGKSLPSGERVEVPHSGSTAIAPTTATSVVTRRGERWLAIVKSDDGESLCLSIFRPSSIKRRGYAKAGAKLKCGNIQSSGTQGEVVTAAEDVRETAGMQCVERSKFRLSAKWQHWADLGYGPLQWMSHAQKRFFGELALSWVAIQEREYADLELHYLSAVDHKSDSSASTACLRLKPSLASSTRLVNAAKERELRHPNAPIVGNVSSLGRRKSNLAESEATLPDKSAPKSKYDFADVCMSAIIRDREQMSDPVYSVEEHRGLRRRVTVRDQGQVLAVQIQMEDDEMGKGGREASCLEETFGVEAWRGTGLGELLWLDHPWRQYLARRLMYQVRRVFGDVQASGQRKGMAASTCIKAPLL